MTGNGRNLTLVPAPDDRITWVPVWDLPWRDDERDLKPTDTVEEAS
jgi:hypothetical protein